MWLLSALGLAIALLGVIGEYRGWWNDVGELFISFGTVASVATGIIALLIDATKTQVLRVATGIEANGATLDGHGAKLDRIHEDHGAKLDRNGAKLDEVNRNLEDSRAVLVEIRDPL